MRIIRHDIQFTPLYAFHEEYSTFILHHQEERKTVKILKTLTQREDAEHNRSDCWTFYDNIESARVYFDGVAKASCIALHFKGTEGEMVIALHDVAYLCNDAGKTIERLGPAATRTAHKAMYPNQQ